MAKNIKPKASNEELIQCGFCNESKQPSKFNKSFNPLHVSGYLPYCKDCIKKYCYDDSGNVNLEKLKDLLRMIDRPYLHDLFLTSCNSAKTTKSIVGEYFKNLGLKQNRYLGWEDSIFEKKEDFDGQAVTISPSLDNEERNRLLLKWGFGYSDEELFSFERKYNMLKHHYMQQTAMHTEALLTYIRYRVKEELATARGDVGEAQKWGNLADKASERAKINPAQLTKADLSNGLSSFGEMARTVEKAKDIIEILPKFKEKPQDKVDFTLWCYINYVRRLKNLPDAEYKDIYNFYEERKNEYKREPNREFEFEDE